MYVVCKIVGKFDVINVHKKAYHAFLYTKHNLNDVDTHMKGTHEMRTASSCFRKCNNLQSVTCHLAVWVPRTK